ncbi:MAG: GvpL/GvpF family gas vesicle protein [Pseudomonadota bacterium]
MSETHRYYYAVMPEDTICQARLDALTAKPIGGGTRFFMANTNGLSIIYSGTDQTEILSTRRHMLNHTRILEGLMEKGAILPFRFGVIGPENGALENIITMRATDLRSQLNALQGQYEMGIRISWERSEIMKRVVADDADLSTTYDALKGRPDVETHYARVELGRKVHTALSERRSRESEMIARRIEERALRSARLDLHDDMSILNGAYLVDKHTEQSILSLVEEFDQASPDLYRIKILSPVPPFNFVSIDLNPAEAAA